MDTREAGRLGGKAGRGEAKKRGDSDYYRALRAKRLDAILIEQDRIAEERARVEEAEERERERAEMDAIVAASRSPLTGAVE